MHKFKKGDVVMVGEKGPAPWHGKWPRGDVGVVNATSLNPNIPLGLDLGPDAEFIAYFAAEELYYIGRL